MLTKRDPKIAKNLKKSGCSGGLAPQNPPRNPQDPPKTPPRPPKTPPRPPKTLPRLPKTLPKPPRDTQKRPQKHLKILKHTQTEIQQNKIENIHIICIHLRIRIVCCSDIGKISEPRSSDRRASSLRLPRRNSRSVKNL